MRGHWDARHVSRSSRQPRIKVCLHWGDQSPSPATLYQYPPTTQCNARVDVSLLKLVEQRYRPPENFVAFCRSLFCVYLFRLERENYRLHKKCIISITSFVIKWKLWFFRLSLQIIMIVQFSWISVNKRFSKVLLVCWVFYLVSVLRFAFRMQRKAHHNKITEDWRNYIIMLFTLA